MLEEEILFEKEEFNNFTEILYKSCFNCLNKP